MDQKPAVKPVPVILLTGFLGSGKTTLLNRLIGHYTGQGIDLAVLVNEFGSIGIDGALLKDGDYHRIELNRGSIFCVCVRTDFISEVKKIAKDIRPELLLIEATGIARPDDLYAMMKVDSLDRLIEIRSNVCVADAGGLPRVIDTLEAVRTQLKYADRIILNKISDVRGTDSVTRRIREINPDAEIFQTDYCEIDPGNIGSPAAGQKDVPAELTIKVPEEFYSWSHQVSGPLDLGKWQAFIEAEKGRLYRAKGVIDLDGSRKYFEVVNNAYSESEVPEKLQSEQDNIMVFIGPDVSEKDLKPKVESLKA